jgi:hypothetical protein
MFSSSHFEGRQSGHVIGHVWFRGVAIQCWCTYKMKYIYLNGTPNMKRWMGRSVTVGSHELTSENTILRALGAWPHFVLHKSLIKWVYISTGFCDSQNPDKKTTDLIFVSTFGQKLPFWLVFVHIYPLPHSVNIWTPFKMWSCTQCFRLYSVIQALSEPPVRHSRWSSINIVM